MGIRREYYQHWFERPGGPGSAGRVLLFFNRNRVKGELHFVLD